MSDLTILSSLLVFALLAAVLGVIARRAARARRRVRTPSCGKCHYEIATLGSGRCPECGSNLLEVGVVTPRMDRPTTCSLAALLMFWSILCVLLCLVLSPALLTVLGPTSLARRERVVLTQSYMPMVFEHADGHRAMSALYSVDLTGELTGHALNPPEHAEVEVQLDRMSAGSVVGVAASMRVTLVIEDGAWHALPAHGSGAQAPLPLDAGLLDSLYGSVGLDTADDALAKERDDLMAILQHLLDSPLGPSQLSAPVHLDAPGLTSVFNGTTARLVLVDEAQLAAGVLAGVIWFIGVAVLVRLWRRRSPVVTG